MKYACTVVLACHNKENYLSRCLDSLVKQSRFEEFEIVVVDDHSSDDSPKIIREYSERHINITLVEFAVGSGGPSRPRNVGIDRATTPYVIFADPDDMVVNDGYSLLLTEMERRESDILIAAREGVDRYGVQKWVDFIEERPYQNVNNDYVRQSLLWRPPFILKTIYSIDLLKSHNIRFLEGISTSEDEIFDMSCLAHAKRVTKINNIVYRYSCESEGSITTSVSPKVFEQLALILPNLDQTYKMMFDEATTVNRINNLLNYYLGRIAFLTEDRFVPKALEDIRSACEILGFDRLRNTDNELHALNLSRIENREFVILAAAMFRRELNSKKSDLKQLSGFGLKHKIYAKARSLTIARLLVKRLRGLAVFAKSKVRWRR